MGRCLVRITQRWFIGEVDAVSPKAMLFQGQFWHGPEWLPFSQITSTPLPGTSEVLVEVSEWMSRTKGIREFQEFLVLSA